MPAIKTATLTTVVLLIATLAACSGNGTFSPSGGLNGTGSSPLGPSAGSTTIIGTTNSLTASPTSLQPRATVDAGVQICITGEATCTSVDGSGRFELAGDFSGDVTLLVVGPDGPIAEFTILGVVEGETIVVRVELDDDGSHIDILSRSHDGANAANDDPGSDDPSSDDISDDVSNDVTDDASDETSDDASEDDVSDDTSDDDSSDDVSNDDDTPPSPV